MRKRFAVVDRSWEVWGTHKTRQTATEHLMELGGMICGFFIVEMPGLIE